MKQTMLATALAMMMSFVGFAAGTNTETTTTTVGALALAAESNSGNGAQDQAQHTNTQAAASATITAPSVKDRGYFRGRFGAGAVFGEPTGASLKYWLNDTMAVDGVIGVGFHEETDFYLHSSFLWHKFDLFSVPKGRLPLYFGVGPRLKLRDGQERFGVRVPVGVSYMFEDTPVDVFLEVAPILDFTPSVRGGFTVGIGARYWF